MPNQPDARVTLMTNDVAGNRLLEVINIVLPPDSTPVDTMAWQYDVLGRMMGMARRRPPPTNVLNHFNECHWDGAWRASQPCGMGAIAFLGSNVSRSSQGWTFFQAPGIDETLLSVEKVWWGLSKRLQSVTDGRGQLLAIADSLGDITAPYAGAGYDQGAWKDGGLTSRAQTYSPRRWETDDDWGEMQQFRHRAYDPRSARWLQEDPIGLSGGVNLYRYNNGDPVSFSDPFGMCPEDAGGDGKTEGYDDCPPGTSGYYAYLSSQGKGSLLNDILGTMASCSEDLLCEVAAMAGAAAAGGPVVVARVTSGAKTALKVVQSNRYLRIGVGRHASRKVFRMAGNVIKIFKKKNPHIDLWDLGPW